MTNNVWLYRIHTIFLTSTIVAPYGQSDVKDLRSIFEVPHLRERAVFLDTQCEIFPLVMYSY